jgi:hypothetical protein
MANYIDNMLQEATLKRERRVSRVKKNINDELEVLVQGRGTICEEMKGILCITIIYSTVIYIQYNMYIHTSFNYVHVQYAYYNKILYMYILWLTHK